MKINHGILAFSAMGTLLLLGGNTAQAKSADTEKKYTKSNSSKVVKVTVKSGETLSSIAKDHKTTYMRLFNANKNIQNPNTIDIGDKVRIPKKGEKLPNRLEKILAMPQTEVPAVTQQQIAYYYGPATNEQTYQYAAQASQSYYGGASTNGNSYAKGFCTWWVKEKRGDLPNMLGNGGQWSGNAAAQGYKTGSAPRAGAVAEQAGHVAYVESVNKNGSVNVSEMNYAGGIGQVNRRTVAANTFSYIY